MVKNGIKMSEINKFFKEFEVICLNVFLFLSCTKYDFLQMSTSKGPCSMSNLYAFQEWLVNIMQSSDFGHFKICFLKYIDYIMNIVSDNKINHKEQFEISGECLRIVKVRILNKNVQKYIS